MIKPIIIFGAGASRSLQEIRNSNLNESSLYPPLTNELFEERFAHIISKFNHIKEILQQIEFIVRSKRSLETYLNELSKKNTETSQMQLIEIRFYLQDLFKDINDRYFDNSFRNSSYYYQFLTDLQRYFEKSCIITFNYDLFLDEAFENKFGYQYNSIKSYYKDRQHELFKVHGSINWEYNLPLLGIENFDTFDKRTKFVMEAIENRKEKGQPLIPTFFNRQGDRSKIFPIPALAIPLPDTKEFIVKEHKSLLINNIKKTNKIIIIGWSANDDIIVKLIMNNVDLQNTKLVVVSPNSAKAISDKFNKKDEKTWEIEPKIVNKSFSALVSEPGELDEIFGY